MRDYIVESVGGLLDSAEISYVKWDMNRQLAGVSGEYMHRYILGLYEVLHRVFDARPQVLLESCSSGGNRFDLGMLCFSPQIWASDDTDAVERLDIQKGLSYLYPLSAMGAHVSACPNAQTLRRTPMGTRFAVSCFGCLGWELDLRELTPAELREARRQTEFYKKHRTTLQYGRFYRFELPDGREGFSCVARDGSEAVTGHFRRFMQAAPESQKLPCAGLDTSALYEVESLAAAHADIRLRRAHKARAAREAPARRGGHEDGRQAGGTSAERGKIPRLGRGADGRYKAGQPVSGHGL